MFMYSLCCVPVNSTRLRYEHLKPDHSAFDLTLECSPLTRLYKHLTGICEPVMEAPVIRRVIVRFEP